jgi:sulfite reductase (NADPH) flavoprotein alpha-component
MAILRFALPKASLWQRLTGQGLARFEAGDLLGILPEGSAVPRFYSLASGSRRLHRDRRAPAPGRPVLRAS